MINYFLFVLLPHLDCYIQVIGITGFTASFIACLVKMQNVFDSYDDETELKAKGELRKTSKLALAFIILLTLSIPIPNKKELIQLKAINVLSEIKGLDQIPQKLIDNLNKLLDVKEQE